MSNKTNQEINNFLTDLQKQSPLDLNDYLQHYFGEAELDGLDQANAFYQMEEILNAQGAFDIEVIYYHTAMDYLRENDVSLQESLGLAHEMGFEADNLNSETLASILKSQIQREAFAELEPKITEFFNN